MPRVKTVKDDAKAEKPPEFRVCEVCGKQHTGSFCRHCGHQTKGK